MTTVNNRKVSPPSGKDEDQRETGFLNRPRAGGKSVWDWLNLIGLLLIPLVVGAATIGFGLLQLHLADLQHQSDQKLAQEQHVADEQSALDQQRAVILQTYIDNIQDLLLNHNLLKSKRDDSVAILARARTITALQGLDSERKGRLLTFLHEAKLIGFVVDVHKTHDSIIYLIGANLSGAFLEENADLQGADLSNANLSGANLYSVYNLTQQQLDQVRTCKNATLPPRLTCHHNQ